MSAPILVITRNLPPLTGGMERLSAQMLEALAGDHALIVIGPPGCTPHVDARAVCHECRGSGALSFLVEAALRVLWLVVRGLRPCLVIAASGLTAPLAWAGARLVGCGHLTMVHGLDLVVSHDLYQRLFLPCIRASAMVVANSRNTADLARARGIAADRLCVVHPGIHWPETLPSPRVFRDRHALDRRPLLLAVGRLAARKGLPEFVTRALPRIVAEVPDVLLVVIGEEARDAIRREPSVRARLVAAIAAADLGRHVFLRGHADDAEVAEACVAAQVFVFPLLAVAGDVEGFGMVAAEAAACGLRTVAFDEGGVADAIVPEVTGRLVAAADYGAMAAAIVDELAHAGDAARRTACREAARDFAWPHYAGAIRAIVAKLLPEVRQ